MALKRIKLTNGTYVDVRDASAYYKPSDGIPKTDLSEGVQSSLDNADSAYQKPQSGIPSTDLADGVIPDISGKADKSEMSVVDGVGVDADKTTITLKSGTAATVLNSHQDISGKADKSEMGVSTNGDKTTITLKDGTSAEVLNQHQSISGKADKVANATSGNFAGLDSNGNLTDSGHKHSDYLTQHQDISGKEDKSNKVASISGSSTDTQYPSAKCVYDKVSTIESQVSILASGPEYNDGARCVVFPVSSSATYEPATRCVAFPTLNV